MQEWIDHIEAGATVTGRDGKQRIDVRRCGRWYLVRHGGSRFTESRADVEAAIASLGPDAELKADHVDPVQLCDPLTDATVFIKFSNYNASYPVDIAFYLDGNGFYVLETVGDYHDPMGGGGETTTKRTVSFQAGVEEMQRLATELSPFIRRR